MKALTITLAAAFLTIAGCSPSGQNTTTPTTATTSSTTSSTALAPTGVVAPTGQLASTAGFTPEQLGEIGAAIKKHPDQAQQILNSHGLDQPGFERAIRGVTQNPDLSKRYANAFRKSAN